MLSSILLMSFLHLGALVKGTLYKRSSIDRADFDSSNYKTVEGVRSNIHCGAICQRDTACKLFHLDESTCKLISLTNAHFCKSGSATLSSPVSVHQEATLGDDPTLKEGKTVQAPSVLMTSSSKSAWRVTQSLPVATAADSTELVAAFAADGDRTYSASTVYRSVVDANAFPWIQIEMDREHWVNGVTMLGSSGHLQRNVHREIRVGNTDVSGSGQDKMLCQNQLCYTTGAHQNYEQNIVCAGPLRGRFVTIQKYKHESNDYSMEILEVDVEVYCDPFFSDDGQICLVEEVDACDRQPSGSEVLVESQADKSDWILTASTTRSDMVPNFVKDGNKNGNAFPASIFHSLTQLSDGDTFPWLQVDLRNTKAVKAVHLHSRKDSIVGQQMQWTEVRVGDVDVGAVTPIGSRFCVNALCKTTGSFAVSAHTEDCSSPPLRGRYVTIQRTFYAANPNPQALQALALAEVDMVFYE